MPARASQQLLDVAGYRLRLDLRRVALDDVALAIDEKLGEIPLDRFRAQQARLRLLEILVERRRSRTVHIDLREEREGHAIVEIAELRDLGFVAGLLRAELVAGKSENLQSTRMELLVQRLESLVLRREAALARDVHDQHDFVLVAIEFLLLAVDVLD